MVGIRSKDHAIQLLLIAVATSIVLIVGGVFVLRGGDNDITSAEGLRLPDQELGAAALAGPSDSDDDASDPAGRSDRSVGAIDSVPESSTDDASTTTTTEQTTTTEPATTEAPTTVAETTAPPNQTVDHCAFNDCAFNHGAVDHCAFNHGAGPSHYYNRRPDHHPAPG